MGGDLPVGGVPGGTGTAKAGAPPSPGGGLVDRRARVASRALRPSSSRCASVTAGPVGLGGARGDCGGDVSLSARGAMVLEPRRPRTSVHPPSPSTGRSQLCEQK